MADTTKAFDATEIKTTDDRGNFSNTEVQKSIMMMANEIMLINEKLDFIYGKMKEKDLIPEQTPPQE